MSEGDDKKGGESVIDRSKVRDGHQLGWPEELKTRKTPEKYFPPSLGQHMDAPPLGSE
jgi:hypothetical protein